MTPNPTNTALAFVLPTFRCCVILFESVDSLVSFTLRAPHTPQSPLALKTFYKPTDEPPPSLFSP